MERRRLPRNAPRDLCGELLPIGSALGKAAFGGVSQKSTLDQNGWDRGTTENVKAAPPDSAVLGRRPGHYVPVNTGRERSAVAPVVIGLDPVGTGALRGIEMDRDERGPPVGIGDRDPGAKGDENITVPRHNHAIALRLENASEPLGHVQGQALFADALAWNSTSIMTAVASVEHDGARLAERGGGEGNHAGECCKEGKTVSIHSKKMAKRLIVGGCRRAFR